MSKSGERELRLRAFVAGLAYALLMFLAFAPMQLWVCALAAPLPLVMAMQLRSKRPCMVGLAAAAGTLPFWFFEQYWITRVSAMGYVPVVLFGAMWTWFAVWLGCAVRRKSPGPLRMVWIALVWTGLDYFRGAVFGGGYPWYFVSQPLIDAPGVPEIASIVGQYGVTLMLVFGATAVVQAADERQRKAAMRVLLGVVLTAGAFVWTGVLARPGPSGRPVRIAMVQTNVPSDNKVGWTIPSQLADFERFSELTRIAAKGEPDLIVWPETMLPGGPADPASVATARQRGIYLTYKDENGQEQQLLEGHFAGAIESLQGEVGAVMLIGAKAAHGLRYVATEEGVAVEDDGLYNSALVVANGRIEDRRYDKVHLTPFGETMPFVSVWPWLESKLLALGANGMLFDLSEGRRTTVLEIDLGGDKRIVAGTPICFESTVSGISRSMARGRGGVRANMLFNLTNDGWFGNSDRTRSQHLLLARWRSAELAKPTVRAANTGISAFIGTRGEILESGVKGDAGASRVEGVLTREMVPVSGLTIFSRFGDVAGWASLVGLVVMFAGSVARKKKRGAPPSRA
jgi:apolipoprotein N-acyltransferase